MHVLKFHPSAPPLSVRAVSGELILPSPGMAMARYQVEGIDNLVLPDAARRVRQDGLWQTTCFEMFMGMGGNAYREFNLSPSGCWAAYDFTGYRKGMTDYEPSAMPDIRVTMRESMLIMDVMLSDADVAGEGPMGLSAVIEESDGHKSFWALAHHGQKPDFHDPACFAVPLAAPARS